MAELGAGAISFERLKSMVEALNQLFSILLSQEELTVRDLKVEASRQRTLDEKEVVLIRVMANLEFGELLQDYLASFEGLVADIKGAGFKVSCRMQRIEVEVSLPHVPLAE